MKIAPHRFVLILLAALLPVLSARAQVPGQLQQAIAAPAGLLQGGGQLGYSMAMEGGLIVAGAPDEDSALSHGGVVKVFDAATGARLFVLPNPSGISGDLFGVAVAMSGTRVVVGAPQNDSGATDAGNAYVFDLASATPNVPVAILHKPNPAATDTFGYAVGIDGTLVVVGSLRDDTGAPDAGSAYVYDLASATPEVPVWTLHNPAPMLGDHFGVGAAISGHRVVVGAYGNTTGSDVGHAYVYDLASATPTVPVVFLHNPDANNYFGQVVTISGTRVVVGAPLEASTHGNHTGSVYVYDLSSATPDQPVTSLHNPFPAPNDLFGNAVAFSGTRLVVGAYGADTVMFHSGTVYIYDLASATPTVPEMTLNNPTPGQIDLFGSSVAIVGTRVVVGAAQDDTGATDAGSLYVYDLASTTPTTPLLTLNDPTPAIGDDFGQSVAIAGMRVVIGAPGDNTGAPSAGRAYAYDLGGSTPTTPVVVLNNPAPSPGDEFGGCVAISGGRVVVGARGDDAGASAAGSAYVFDLGSPTPSVPVLTLHKPGPGVNDYFGSALAISGARVVVGACNDDTGATDAGSAYVYDLDGATPDVPVATLHDPAAAAGDSFGCAVAISGARVLVGATGDDTGAPNAGSVYVYDLGSTTPTVPVEALHHPSPAGSDYFGASLAISGPRAVVGVPYDDDGGLVDVGIAYVYDLSSASPAIPVATLHKPTPGAGDQFGAAVAIDGTTVAIGAPLDDTVATDKGYAYVFGPNPNDQDNNGLLDAWEIARFGNATGHLATDDDDHDGFSNLLKEAFNPTPLTQNTTAAVPAVVNEGGYLTMTITKRAGVTYQVQSAASPDPAAFSAADTTVLIDNATTLKVRDNFPIGTTPGRFLRVQVTAAP